MNHVKLLSTLCLLSLSLLSQGQIGGTYTYEWLGSPVSARLTALGGALITEQDDDLALAANNPALLNTASHRSITANHNFAFAGVSNGYFGYGHSLDSTLHFHIGASYISYGDFVSADELGNQTGTFSGSEGALVIGAGKRLNERISGGVNIKAVFGSLEQYSSFGLVTDIGLLYKNPDAYWEVSFLAKNIGIEISPYGTEAATAPLDIQIGYSRRLKYLPFRFSILAHNLHRLGIRYDDPDAIEDETIFGEAPPEQSSFSKGVDNFFRHLTFGGEFLLGKSQNFRLRFGYSHLRRQELSVSSYRSLAGFSAGFGIRIRGIRIDYGLGYHHLAGAANHISLSTNLDRFTKRR